MLPLAQRTPPPVPRPSLGMPPVLALSAMGRVDSSTPPLVTSRSSPSARTAEDSSPCLPLAGKMAALGRTAVLAGLAQGCSWGLGHTLVLQVRVPSKLLGLVGPYAGSPCRGRSQQAVQSIKWTLEDHGAPAGTSLPSALGRSEICASEWSSLHQT